MNNEHEIKLLKLQIITIIIMSLMLLNEIFLM